MNLSELIDHVSKSLLDVKVFYDCGNKRLAWENLGKLSATIQDELPDCEPEKPAPAESNRPSERHNQADSTPSAEASDELPADEVQLDKSGCEIYVPAPDELPPGEAKVDKSGCAADAPTPEQETNKETV